ncbi:hypothetical protein YFHUAIHA_CDS0141 [Phage C48C1]|nr:hypothetical protein YFHUAIHA_CDS0141 [Phage C48C1]
MTSLWICQKFPKQVTYRQSSMSRGRCCFSIHGI